jgi:hypothetical protein
MIALALTACLANLGWLAPITITEATVEEQSRVLEVVMLVVIMQSDS